MKYRLANGGGRAVYILGVNDEGHAVGLSEIELEESLEVLKAVASECGAVVERVERFQEDNKLIARVLVSSFSPPIQNHITLAVAGHVNHGKSTLLACLMTGQPDDGKKWLYLDTMPHEIERNLSADIHFALLGYRDFKPILLSNPLDREERSRVASQAEKLVSFIDTVGHEPWLRTTIRGILGQGIDYGILVVAADDGPTHITREHLGIMLAMGLPVIVCLTKTGKVGQKRVDEVEDEITGLLKKVGRIPYRIQSEEDIPVVADKLSVVVPIIRTEATTLQGYNLLYSLLLHLPIREKQINKPFLLYVDKIYNVEGVGSVISGSVKQGRLKAGAELLVGPDQKGRFTKVKARSIEMHYTRITEAEAGYIIGVAIRGVKHDLLTRGMILCDQELKPHAVRSFEAEIMVLTHPTRIKNGYEPVVHCHTISSTVKLRLLDREYLKAGETGRVEMVFKYRPWYIKVGDRFVFREGKTKGIGTITRIIETV
ncbi:MAG TPA: GTP-binding protein [Candidatus Caldiarchaeum subterraneum]|uniref:GTP-binding protein n=1 Tax=Caldiarchaeum subterraneum TaxID=311458 RepID=A0A832ZV22_CALS0|nr:GTP-binding protein [Candidatus Caldarchaeum subterraneum]